MDGPAEAPEDLGKLTVAQLKAICKERKITAYSKLAKPAIIQKIILQSRRDDRSSECSPKTVSRPKGASSQQPNAIPAANAGVIDRNAITSNQASPINSAPPTHAHKQAYTTVSTTNSSSNVPTHSSSVVALSPTVSNPIVKRKAMLPPADVQDCPKKKKTTGLSGLLPISDVQLALDQPNKRASSPASLHATDSRSRTRIPNGYFPSQVRNNSPSTQAIVIPNTVKSLGLPASATNVLQARNAVVPLDVLMNEKTTVPKRFVPLVLKKANLPHLNLPPTTTELIPPTPLNYLDFSLTPTVSLQPVSLPPSLSQRKRVARLALVFSFFPGVVLHKLSRVSRLFRYAAYLSAVPRLSRLFSGDRLRQMLNQYSQNTTNMWPYLRLRDEEALGRRRTYSSSFLGKVLRYINPVADNLWTSPDNARQITVAIRFLLTRLFFHVSIGHNMDEKTTILDVQELVEGEIWTVQLSSSKGKEVLYVLESTCEVVGHPPAPTAPELDEETAALDSDPLRADWSLYISQRLSSSAPRPPSLMQYLKWTNHEEYYRGISKLWLSRTQCEGELGAAKVLVAERYILACVVGNSVSGRWMSSTEMAQDFNGLPQQVAHTRRDPTLTLFLPAHHHVESLHFTSSRKEPLHPAIAVVQTPGRAFFILKDNGMQIGTEEEGVALVWMQMLDCDATGRINQ